LPDDDRRRSGSRRRRFRTARLQLASEEKAEIPADPLLRFAVISEAPLMRVESAVMPRADDVMKIFVMDDRLNEEGRHSAGVEKRMNANLTGPVIVGAEPDASSLAALDAVSPTDREPRVFLEVGPMDFFSQRLEVVDRSRRVEELQRQRL
jgi:hypothetical protein